MKLSARIRQKVYEGSLVMPSLPAVGSKILSQIRSDKSVNDLAKTLKSDPILCARIVSLSNSVFYRAWADHKKDTKNMSPSYAVQLIGTERLRSIVISFVLEQLFVSQRSDIKAEMRKDWERRVRITCAAMAINSHIPNPVDPDKLMLFCMTVNIGILPCYYYIEESGAEIDVIDPRLVSYVTLNMLRSWDLDFTSEPSCAASAISCEDLFSSAILFLDTPTPKLSDTFQHMDVSVCNDDIKASYNELLSVFIG